MVKPMGSFFTALSLLALVPLLVAFAPVPPVRGIGDPCKEVETFANFAKSGEQLAVSKRKEFILRRFSVLEDELASKDRKSQLQLAQNCRRLLADLEREKPLGGVSVRRILEGASVDGKYTELLHALYVPGDTADFGGFRDYGFWTGTTYKGYSDLPSGYWVYLAPRWFIWKCGPRP